MRLIDADKLIKDIDYSADLGGALGKVVEAVKTYAKFMAQTAPTIEPQQWIPCSERLPEGYKDVLCWYEYFRYGNYNRLYQTYGVGYYNSNYDCWGGDVSGHKARAIAWCELPEPYREESNDES